MANPSFAPLQFNHTLQFRHGDTRAFVMEPDEMMSLSRGGSWFIFVFEGRLLINGRYMLSTGMYACVHHADLYTLEHSLALIVHHPGAEAMFMVGGPVEERGRLRYIDGCTDSLLIPPVKRGDPCLNYLHFPPFTRQSMHTHPSLRLGIVFGGHGTCITPFGNAELRPGTLFAIMPEDGRMAKGLDGMNYHVGSHCFETQDSELRVVAFHPDSTTGPTDEDHQMLNATLIAGVSVGQLRRSAGT